MVNLERADTAPSDEGQAPGSITIRLDTGTVMAVIAWAIADEFVPDPE